MLTPTSVMTLITKEEIAIVQPDTQLYLVKSPIFEINVVGSINNEQQSTILHNRFGHCSHKALNQTLKLMNENSFVSETGQCHTCLTAKMKGNPYMSYTSPKANEPYERIHCDLIDFHNYQSLEGYKIALIITDEYSRYSTVLIYLYYRIVCTDMQLLRTATR